MNTNNKSAFAVLTQRIIELRRLSNYHLFGSSRGGDITKLADAYDIGSELSSRGDDWMMGSVMKQWATELEQRHETFVLEAMEACFADSGESEAFNKIVDERAEATVRMVFGYCWREIVKSESSSSNVISNVAAYYKREAMKKIMSCVCGIQNWDLESSTHVVDDVFNGIERRRKEAEEAQRQIISKIVYGKNDQGEYYAIPYNHNGEIVQTREIVNVPVKRKGDALTLIASFVKQQRESGNQRSIIVEAEVV